jgi:hypothetical protein
MHPSGGSSATLAEASHDFTVPEIAGGRSEEPLDLGTITVQVRPQAKIGEPAPPLQARNPDGSTIRLSDFRGKYVLLYFIQPYALQDANSDSFPLSELRIIRDRFASSDRMVMLAVALESQREPLAQYVKRNRINWPIGLVENWEKTLAPQYVNFPDWAYLIDPEGKVLGISPSSRATYTGLETTTLGQMRYRKPGIQVMTEMIAGHEATPQFAFKTIPTLSSEDAGQKATFSIVDGQKADFGGEPSILNDGLGPRFPRDEPSMLAFAPDTLEGRLKADLGRIIEIEQINSYSWHRDSHRYVQVYRLYGSDGSVPAFDPEPKIGVDPATCGWTLIAEVDTRLTPGGIDLRENDAGQMGVSIRGQTAAIGKYRYLLFVIFTTTETKNRWDQTYWSEIDIVERK